VRGVEPKETDRAFPTVPWFGETATFIPGACRLDERPWAVVVFVIWRRRFVLASVPRGWCTPSGRVEPEERPEDAATRETLEETGAVIRSAQRIGTFAVRGKDGGVRSAGVFLARAVSLGPIPAGTESAGARLFTLDEVPGAYWHWDALMSAMFEHAWALVHEASV
jgi:8-oxo-dGTP pyrophosphatase MutT (NUDIX family)